MDCADAKLRMEPYATGNLASPDREEFEKHLADCEGCRLELDLMRAGVSGGGGRPPAEAPPGPPLEVMRSGDPGFMPGAAFGASSGLDEASFADVASQLSEEGAFDSLEIEQVAPPAHASSRPEPQSAPPPPPPAAEVPRSVLEPSARSLPGGEEQDYSFDSILADAGPAAPETEVPPPSPVDPLANVAPRTSRPASARPPAPAPPEKRAGKPPSWEFEPAEAGRAAAPPEESLFFAEETLARARDAGGRRRSGAAKLALWVAGAGVGVGLLVFAAWIAWNAQPSDQTAQIVAQRYAVPERHTTVEPVTGRAAGEETPEVQAPEAAAGGGAAPEDQSPAEHAPGAAPAPPSRPPALPASSVSPSAPLPRETGPAAPPAPTRTSRPSRTKPAIETRPEGRPAQSVTPPETASAGAAAPKTAPRAAPPAPLHAEPAERTPEAGAALRATAPAPAESIGGGGPSLSAPPHSAAPRSPDHASEEPIASPDHRAPATETPALSPAPTPTIAPPMSPPAGSRPGESPTGGEGDGAPPAEQQKEAPAPARPIDRLHLATAAAEQRGDLRTLRDMRETWKHFLEKSGVGPDRIRAKRELADCLWAIQALTGRRSDQRDALRAYRDYLLNAPAGGADRRTVSRTKQLQDALSESN